MAVPLPAKRAPIHELLRQEKFDVLHVQVPYSPAMAGRVIKAADAHTAVVGTFHIAPHSGLVTVANRLLGMYVRSTLQRFDAMTATSVPAQEFAKQTFRIDSEVVPLPLKLDSFYNAQPFPQYATGKNVVFLGRLVERKGCRYLLQAVAHLHKNDTWPQDARVIICGKGPLEQELRTYAQRNNIASLVEFVGYISEEDKPRYLAGGDVVVYPSTGGESFGIVLLEAMAAARGAVLAGDNPGYASVMAPRPDSLFDPHDTPMLAEKIRAMLTDVPARNAAHNWQRTYVQRFDVGEVGKRFLDVYARALQSRRR
jgi:phosphatidylinositol alpha-mannosyltransferase